MKKLTMLLFLQIILCFYSSLCFSESSADEDIYVEEPENSEFVNTSDLESSSKYEENIVSQKSTTETNKYEYDIEFYPYVSVKYKSTKTRKEGN